MELVCASSKSILKLCGFPSNAGGGSGASEAPGSSNPNNNTPQPSVIASWKPSAPSLDPRPLGSTNGLLILSTNNELVSSHSFNDDTGSILFHHTFSFKLQDDDQNEVEDPKLKIKQPKTDSGDSKPQKPKLPTIVPSCKPLKYLFSKTETDASLQHFSEHKRFLKITKSGKFCCVSYEEGLEPYYESSTSKSLDSNLNGLVEFEVDLGHEICHSRLNTFSSSLATIVGPRETLTSVMDLEKQSKVWQARNVSEDSLRMKVPVWDTSSDWTSDSTFLTCTAFSHVRLYDIRAQRQPTLSITLCDEYAKSVGSTKFQQLTRQDHNFALRNIVSNPYDRNIAVTTSNTGDVFVIDISRPSDKGHIVSRQKGVSGSVRDCVYHPSRKHALVVTGLDRYVRSWDTSKSRNLGILYTKLHMNKIAFSNILQPILTQLKKQKQQTKKVMEINQIKRKSKKLEDNGDIDSDASGEDDKHMEEDDMWNSLKSVRSSSSSSKKRKRQSN